MFKNIIRRLFPKLEEDDIPFLLFCCCDIICCIIGAVVGYRFFSWDGVLISAFAINTVSELVGMFVLIKGE